MTYAAKITLKYDSTWDRTGGIYDEEMIPEEHITFECPVDDLNSIQLFQFFAKFALAMGHNEAGIAKGAAYVAFNDMRSFEDMKKTADDYDLVMKEDHIKTIGIWEEEIRELKEKLARVLPGQYDEEDIKAIIDESTDGGYNAWGNLIPGSPEAYDKGCKCPILDNQDMPNYKKWVNADCPLHGKAK
jgi:hypothetical protein